MAQKRDYEYTNEELVAIAAQFPEFSSPSFQFYPNDFLGSSRTMVMGPAEVGAFCLLLMIEWNEKDCGLPTDATLLARLSRLGEDWQKYGPHLREMFFEFEGRMFNRRLLHERRKQIEKREQRVVAAHASVASRKTNKLQKSTSADAPLNERSPSAKAQLTAAKAEIGRRVWDMWQSRKATTTHRAFTRDMAKNVALWLDDYSEGELVQAVKNYDEVLGGSEYWWTYSFTFEDFFRRGSIQKPSPFKKFLTEAKPLDAFRVKEAQPGQVQLVEDDHYAEH